jgi:hypothetical protein
VYPNVQLLGDPGGRCTFGYEKWAGGPIGASVCPKMHLWAEMRSNCTFEHRKWHRPKPELAAARDAASLAGVVLVTGLEGRRPNFCRQKPPRLLLVTRVGGRRPDFSHQNARRRVGAVAGPTRATLKSCREARSRTTSPAIGAPGSPRDEVRDLASLRRARPGDRPTRGPDGDGPLRAPERGMGAASVAGMRAGEEPEVCDEGGEGPCLAHLLDADGLLGAGDVPGAVAGGVGVAAGREEVGGGVAAAELDAADVLPEVGLGRAGAGDRGS